MKLFIRYIFIITTLVNTTFCLASNDSDKITIGNKVTFNSKILNEQQELWIYTPNDYDAKKKYHVLYLLDGDELFHPATGIVMYLAANEFISETILIGVKTNLRVRDYLPPIVGEPKSNTQRFISSKFPDAGGANFFLNYFEQELIPYIDQTYSTLPHRTLIGHSNGGVLALHTLVSKPNLFTNYLIMSPAAWWSEQEIDDNIKNLFANNKDIKGNLYMSVAGEGNQFLSNALRISANLEMHSPRSFSWNFKHMDDENHLSTIHPSLYDGLKKIYEEYKISNLDDIAQYRDIESVKSFYNALSLKYNHPVTIPQSVINSFAYKQMRFGRIEQALTSFKFNAQKYPETESVHLSLGDGYMANKEYSLAKSSYQKAIELAKKHESKHLDYFMDMLKNAEATISRNK